MTDYSNYDSDVFSCQYEGDTAVICLKANSLKMTTDPHHFHDILECMNTIEVDANIKGILALHTVKYERIEALQSFIKSIQKQSGYVQKEMGVTRYGNSVKRLTLAINDFSKPCVVGIEGQVAIDGFGFFMACDQRVAADDLSIEFPGLEIGVTPMGAVALYMSRQMGANKALEILMSKDPVKAEEAKQLGFVTTVVPKEQVKEECMKRLQEMYKIPGVTLSLTKQLIRPKTYELEEHFELSSRLLWSSIVDN